VGHRGRDARARASHTYPHSHRDANTDSVPHGHTYSHEHADGYTRAHEYTHEHTNTDTYQHPYPYALAANPMD